VRSGLRLCRPTGRPWRGWRRGQLRRRLASLLAPGAGRGERLAARVVARAINILK